MYGCNPPKVSHFASARQNVCFFPTLVTCPNSLLVSRKLVKVIELKWGGTEISKKWHVTVCFETCTVVTRNIQWEVTLACSALQAPYTDRINPKHSHSPEIYWQEQQQRQTNRPKRYCPWNNSHFFWSSLFCRCAFRIYIKKKTLLIVLAHSGRHEFFPEFPVTPQWSWELKLKATACKCIRHASKWRKRCHRLDSKYSLFVQKWNVEKKKNEKHIHQFDSAT